MDYEEGGFLMRNQDRAALDKSAKTKEPSLLDDFFVSNEVAFKKIGILTDEIAGLLNWPEILDDVNSTNGFAELNRLFYLNFQDGNIANHSSNCWSVLAAKNYDQLLEYGYNNFKRTIGHNYFNFLIQKGDIQIQSVEALLSKTVIESCKTLAHNIPHDINFSANEQYSYNYFVLLLWEYTKQIDTKNLLDKLDEPKEGNPILVWANGKSMSQDLANSLIEYYSMQGKVDFGQIKTVLEIGGGYGRNAHVILKLNPSIRIVLVDIMPALYIAQRYLSSIFRNCKIFKARHFEHYHDVKIEMESANIVFLLPHQLALLPDNEFDLCMNISSFGEMNLQQIKWYFEQIDRLTLKYFYMKQWNVSKNPFDGLILNKCDYPFANHWTEIYSRTCAVQKDFFETLFKLG